METPYLARMAEASGTAGTVLDIGCGAGEPVARYFIEQGLTVTGVDLSAALLAKSRARFPVHEWIHADMHGLSLGRRFDAVLAWDSFFHLTAEGTAYGDMAGHMFHHASLDTTEYTSLLAKHGFMIMLCDIDNKDCGGRTVWLAQYAPDRRNDCA